MGRKKNYKAPEGLVRQSKSQCWYIKCRVNGKLIYKSTRTSDIHRAELILSKVKVALLSLDSQVKQIVGRSIPFNELMKRYTNEVSSGKRSFRSDITNQKPLLKFFESRRIDTITRQNVYQFQDWRKNTPSERTGKPISGPSVNREIALLRHALKKAVRWGYIDQNPAEGIEGFPENKRDRYITDQEFEDIKKIAAARRESKHLSDIMDALYLTSQRKERILRLKWSQISLEDRTIRFEQVSRTKKVPFLLWINEPLYRLLLRLRSERSSMKVVGQYVFQKRDGSRLGSIKTTWAKCCAKANVNDVKINDIRHKAITDMVEAGFSLETVGRVAGHTEPSTTQRYTHLTVEATRAVLESLGKRVKVS